MITVNHAGSPRPRRHLVAGRTTDPSGIDPEDRVSHRSRTDLDRCSEPTSAVRLAEIKQRLEGSISEHPEDGRLWTSLGLVLHALGEFEGASHALETAGLLVPLDPASRCVLAESWAKTGHADLAASTYQELAADRRCPDDLLPEIAAGLGLLGLYGSALGTCLELVRRCPGLAEAHFGVAFYLRRLGRPPESILAFVARAHELAPDVALYRISVATLLDHAGRREEARDLIRDLDLDAVSCRGCLRRMSTIFLAGPLASRSGPAS